MKLALHESSWVDWECLSVSRLYHNISLFQRKRLIKVPLQKNNNNNNNNKAMSFTWIMWKKKKKKKKKVWINMFFPKDKNSFLVQCNVCNMSVLTVCMPVGVCPWKEEKIKKQNKKTKKKQKQKQPKAKTWDQLQVCRLQLIPVPRWHTADSSKSSGRDILLTSCWFRLHDIWLLGSWWVNCFIWEPDLFWLFSSLACHECVICSVIRSTEPFGVVTSYEFGSCRTPVTTAGSQALVSGFSTLTRCPSYSGARSGPACLSWLVFIFDCFCFSFALGPSWSWILSPRWKLGKAVRTGRPNSSSAGDGIPESTGVARRFNMARCRSWLDFLHFCINIFIVLTIRSVSPFDCGKRGENVVWVIPHFWHMSLYGWPAYWGPLRLKMPDVAFAMVSLLASGSLRSIGYLRVVVIKRKFSPSSTNRSLASFVHGVEGISCGWSGSFCCLGWYSWHTSHAFTSFSMSL